MKEEIIIIELPKKIVRLHLTPFDTDVNVEELLEVQHHNLYGELITISRLWNKIGNLRAEMNELLSETKLDFDIFYAQKQEEVRKELTFTRPPDTKGMQKVEKPTIGEVESAIIRTPEYKIKKRQVFTVQKNFEYIDSLHEAVKNKSFVIMKMSDKLKPDDFEKEIVEGSVNGVMITFAKKSIN